MKLLNLKTVLFLALVTMISFSSCKKNKDDIAPPALTAEGVWTGMYGTGNNVPSTYFSFVINKDGTMVVKANDVNNPALGTGTWKIIDGTFTGIYYYNGFPAMKYNVSAKIDLTKNTMEGSFGTGETIADDGTYSMTR